MTACPARTALRRAVVAAPKARPEPNRGHALNDRYRRVSLIALCPGKGRLTQPIAGTQPWRGEQVFMPLSPSFRAGAIFGRAGREGEEPPAVPLSTRFQFMAQDRKYDEWPSDQASSAYKVVSCLEGLTAVGP